MILRTVLLFLLSFATAVPAIAEAPLKVFAAASLSEALTEIGDAFQTETGVPVVFSFAGSGVLARQIEAGAPADVVISADSLWMDYLLQRGAVRGPDTKSIASNALVLIGSESIGEVELTEEALMERLDGQRLAIADPETVPAGRYGRAALTALGLWGSVEDHLAPMENVRVALASVARGDTPLGLVYATDARIEPSVSIVARVPEDSHPEILYPAAIPTSANHPAANRFLEYLNAPKSQNILQSFGFLVDKEH